MKHAKKLKPNHKPEYKYRYLRFYIKMGTEENKSLTTINNT